jgi:hypothetical protein
VGLCAAALFVYAFGVIAPLTPSHGLPSFGVLLIFAGLPIALTLVASRYCQSVTARLCCYFEAAAIAGFTLYLVLLQSGAFRA